MPRVRFDDPALQGYLRRAEPVVITGGCPFTRALVGTWSLEHLERHFGEVEQPNTHFAPRHTARFARFYGKGLGEGGVTKQSFARFVAQARANNLANERARTQPGERAPSWRFYAQASLLWASSGPDGEPCTEKGGGELRVPSRVDSSERVTHAAVDDELVRELHALDWDWLDRAMAASEEGGFHSCTLWAGYGGGCTPMHFDQLSNFFTQLQGRKRILLFPPSQWPRIYPYPCAHPMDSYAMVDVEAPDVSRFPALCRARGLETTLSPGDVLWLPCFWFHHVRALDEGTPNLSLNCWLGSTPRMLHLGAISMRSAISAAVGREMAAEQSRCAPPPLDNQDIAPYYACCVASATPAADEAADEALIVETAPARGLMSLIIARYLESKMEGSLKSASAAAGFLTAMALGADSLAPSPAPPMRFPQGSPMQALAVNTRCTLYALFGAHATGALLRAITRHGRLVPGPPQVGEASEVVNSEARQVTPPELVERMLASHPTPLDRA